MTEAISLDDWKSKYRQLLRELDQKEGAWEQEETALRGVAVRLAIAAMGRDARVDDYLNTILEVLKNGKPAHALEGELDGLAAEVMRHEKQITVDENADLTGFVTSLPLDTPLQKKFIEGWESDTGIIRAQALKDLASELNDLLTEADDADTTESTLGDVLSALARHMSGVPELELAVASLQQQIDAGLSNESMDTLLMNLAVAVRQVIDSVSKDKKELEQFLEQVTQQLAQFEHWAEGSEQERQARERDTLALEVDVERHFGGLKQDIDHSRDTVDLKARVQQRLDSVADQLRQFRERETLRAAQASERNQQLREEVNQLKSRTAQLAEQCRHHERRLMHDTLTGVHSRLAYTERLQEECQRWRRHGQPVTFAIWDVDHFKRINDTYGHQVGDRVLKVIAAMLSQSTRTEDFVARIGGEEFVTLFPSTDIASALGKIEQIRERIHAANFLCKGQPVSVSASCGVTDFREDDTPESVFARADKALYEAKRNGRNQSVKM
ncbi:MAG: diguanylate cyclase [Pseudomonadota bacterium]